MDKTRALAREISPYSWLVTIGLDLLWTPLEGLVTVSLVGLIVVPMLVALLFCLCASSVTLIQRYSAGESWGAALQKGVLLGVLAAVPLPVFTTAVAAVAAYLRHQTDLDGETILLGQLTKAWRRLELILRNALPDQGRGLTIEEVINHLDAQGLLTKAERSELHDLRWQRNQVVHKNSSAELSELVELIRRITVQIAWRLRFYR